MEWWMEELYEENKTDILNLFMTDKSYNITDVIAEKKGVDVSKPYCFDLDGMLLENIVLNENTTLNDIYCWLIAMVRFYERGYLKNHFERHSQVIPIIRNITSLDYNAI